MTIHATPPQRRPLCCWAGTRQEWVVTYTSVFVNVEKPYRAQQGGQSSLENLSTNNVPLNFMLSLWTSCQHATCQRMFHMARWAGRLRADGGEDCTECCCKVLCQVLCVRGQRQQRYVKHCALWGWNICLDEKGTIAPMGSLLKRCPRDF